MQFSPIFSAPEKEMTDCLVIGLYEDKNPVLMNSLPKDSSKHLNTMLETADIQGKVGQSLMLYHVPGIKAERVLVMGCGKKNELTESQYKKIISSATSLLRNPLIKSASVYLTELNINKRDHYWSVRFAIESIFNQLYEFNQFKSESKPLHLKQIKLAVPKDKIQVANDAIKHATAIAEATSLCRNLGNTPSNICTPRYMADQAHALANRLNKITTKVLDEKALKQKGMNLISAVGQGSEEESQLIEIHYKGGNKNDAPVVLVGKGVTFDTGGICIKPSSGMLDMKLDMSGAATMLSVVSAAAELKLPINITALLPCVENMPGGKAFKPSDVIKSYAGKTVEIIDTDAEGRLILADALAYALEFKPAVLIDTATLTGAVVIALGYHHTGLISNDDSLADALLEAGNKAQDLAWRLPINEDYQAQIESKVADFANLGNDRSAGTITAACFLARFVDKTPWAHLDIAGSAMQKSANTGRPVALLVQYLIDYAKDNKLKVTKALKK